MIRIVIEMTCSLMFDWLSNSQEYQFSVPVTFKGLLIIKMGPDFKSVLIGSNVSESDRIRRVF